VGGLLTAAEQEPGGVVPGHPARASAQSAPSQVAGCERGAGGVHAAALAPPGGSTAARLGRARRGGRGRAGGLWRRVQRPRLGAGARVCAGRGGRGRARQRRAVRPFGSHSQCHAPPPHGGPWLTVRCPSASKEAPADSASDAQGIPWSPVSEPL